ncbi:hypothetical protein [Streptomyces sp. enrichment culture]|uniref:hypothetical protein n=1 Tax=Streptomyces sp. enrichment culture TaxID=1795815 RepID=UPI003F5451B9
MLSSHPPSHGDPGDQTAQEHAHDAAARTAGSGDDGTDGLPVSQVVRTGELQSWSLAEHLVDTPPVRS